MIVKFKKLIEEATLPIRVTEGAAGYDLRLPGRVEAHKVIMPNEIVLLPLGFSVELPKGTFLTIASRSGLAKKGLIVQNTIPVIDEDYRGEVMVMMRNTSDQAIEVHPSDRIAQALLLPYIPMEFEETDLSTTDRGAGGFGSTGVK